ncbi:MAG: YtxH domain-containing protein [Chloroflexia bacterium]|nr:YtxH domain-containing protein [Chloroflexia bacterium]
MDSFLKFILGGAAGTAIGLAVGSLLAPQKGADLQAATHQRLEYAKEAGEEAERETESAMQDRFRQRVGDPAAFTPAAGHMKGRG